MRGGLTGVHKVAGNSSRARGRGQHSFRAVFAAAATLLQQRGGQYRPRGQTACRNAAQAAECAEGFGQVPPIRRSRHGRVPINGVHRSPSEAGETSLIAINCGSAMLPWVCHLLSKASVWSLEHGSIILRFLIGMEMRMGGTLPSSFPVLGQNWSQTSLLLNLCKTR